VTSLTKYLKGRWKKTYYTNAYKSNISWSEDLYRCRFRAMSIVIVIIIFIVTSGSDVHYVMLSAIILLYRRGVYVKRSALKIVTCRDLSAESTATSNAIYDVIQYYELKTRESYSRRFDSLDISIMCVELKLIVPFDICERLKPHNFELNEPRKYVCV